MKYRLFKKSFTIGIIVLFVGTSFIPHISGNIRKNRNNEIELEINSTHIQMNDQILVYSKDVDWWPMFKHDLNNVGFSTSDAPDTNNVKWSKYLGDSVSSPAVAEGNIYVGTSDKKVYCLDAETGNQIWSYSTDDDVYLSSPAVADGKVYINEADEVLCLDAETGDQIWSYTSGGGWSSPAVSNGNVYIGSNSNNMYCLDANTGNKIWNYTTGGLVKSSPAVVNGKVYIGSEDKNVYCLDANTGNKIWSYPTGDLVRSSPAVVNGKVYIGSADGNVYCLDSNTGIKLWNYEPCCVHFSSPAVAYEKIYIGGYCDGKVYCLNADTGSKIWSYKTGNKIWSSPAVADGKVYIGSNDHKIYCLFAETGNQMWNYTTSNAVISSPAVAEGNVYVGSGDGILYCFGLEYLPPVSDFDWIPIYPEPSETVNFDASSSYDPDGTIVLYEWDWDNDGVYDESHTTSTATHVWYEEDTYPVTLRITDNDGANDTITKIIYIGIIPPVADFTWIPENPESGETVTFDASNSYDPDGTIILYEWDWDNDGSNQVATMLHLR
jgi:outer membrane protein assembly factor BamB